MTPAWSNAIAAMPDGPFVQDLAQAVSNDGSVQSGQLWLLHFASDYLGSRQSPWPAFDLFVHDFEALDRIWPIFRLAGELIPIESRNTALAKFMAERLPQQWDRTVTVAIDPTGFMGRKKPVKYNPVTVALRLADRIDTLVSLFAAQVTCNGNKDPFALRRAAKEVLAHICFPIGRYEGKEAA
jgi:hypothetical protein